MQDGLSYMGPDFLCFWSKSELLSFLSFLVFVHISQSSADPNDIEIILRQTRISQVDHNKGREILKKRDVYKTENPFQPQEDVTN